MQHFTIAEADAPDLIGAGELLGLARQGWLVLVLGVAGGIAVALLWLQFGVVPDWRAEARVALAPTLAPGGGDRGLADGTEIERLRGAAMLAAVVDALDLARAPGFGRPDDPPLQAALTRFPGGGAPAPGDGPEATARAIERLSQASAVQLIPGTGVARITASAGSAALSAEIAQTYARTYVDQRSAQVADERHATDAALAELAARVAAARDALARFHAAETSPSGGLATVDRELRSNRVRLERARQALRQAPGGAADRLALRRADRSQETLATTTGQLAAELAEQDRLAETLADATAAYDRAREAAMRRADLQLTPAILSDARAPLSPAAPARLAVCTAAAAAGGLGALALLLWRRHRQNRPHRLAAALGLRLLLRRTPRADRAARSAEGRQLAADLPPGPLDLAILPAAPGRSEAAAAAMAADLAAALAATRARPVRLILAAPGAPSGVMAPGVFAGPRPVVTTLGRAMLDDLLSRPPLPPTLQAADDSRITLTPPLGDWSGPALARRAGQVILVLDIRDAGTGAARLRAVLRDAGLRPGGLVVGVGYGPHAPRTRRPT